MQKCLYPRKKKLLVILGAGSSVNRGMPRTSDLDLLMKTWAQDWIGRQRYDCFNSVWKLIEAYYTVRTSDPRPSLSFEKVLGAMMALLHWENPAPWGDLLRPIACAGTLPSQLDFLIPPASDTPAPFFANMLLTEQLTYLLIALAKHMRALSIGLDCSGDKARQYAALFGYLRSAFEIGIYNLNYDVCALASFPDAFTGFNKDGSFEPTAVQERTDWNFLYHLHGSVHHSLVTQNGSEICWRPNLSGEFVDGHRGHPNDRRSAGRSLPKTTLVAGGLKLDQLLPEPFHSFYAGLVRHIYAADAILIGGYGFGDEHVNWALRNRLSIPRLRVPVMVLDVAGSNDLSMQFSSELRAMELRDALCPYGSCFQEVGQNSSPPPSDLAGRGAFELSAQQRVAIWYGGFTQAATRIHSILPWLEGEADRVLL